jgi:hypothetical protein
MIYWQTICKSISARCFPSGGGLKSSVCLRVWFVTTAALLLHIFIIMTARRKRKRFARFVVISAKSKNAFAKPEKPNTGVRIAVGRCIAGNNASWKRFTNAIMTAAPPISRRKKILKLRDTEKELQKQKPSQFILTVRASVPGIPLHRTATRAFQAFCNNR